MIIRKIDHLGRVAIPLNICKELGFKENTKVEIKVIEHMHTGQKKVVIEKVEE